MAFFRTIGGSFSLEAICIPLESVILRFQTFGAKSCDYTVTFVAFSKDYGKEWV